MYDGTLLVVGLSIEFFEKERHAHHQLLLNFPAEIELCGVVKFQDDLSTGTLVKEILQVRYFYDFSVLYIVLGVSEKTFT